MSTPTLSPERKSRFGELSKAYGINSFVPGSPILNLVTAERVAAKIEEGDVRDVSLIQSIDDELAAAGVSSPSRWRYIVFICEVLGRTDLLPEGQRFGELDHVEINRRVQAVAGEGTLEFVEPTLPEPPLRVTEVNHFAKTAGPKPSSRRKSAQPRQPPAQEEVWWNPPEPDGTGAAQ